MSLRNLSPLCGALLVAAVLASCSAHQPADRGERRGPRIRDAPERCTLPGPHPEVVDSLTVGLTDPVDPERILDPITAGELFLFRHLYETPVEIDCEGRPQPGLAVAWRSSADGDRWSLELREDARFWDGSPILAEEVRALWLAGPAGRLFREIEVVGEAELLLTLVAPEPSPDFLFAPSLGVARRSSGQRWPIGSGPYRIESSLEGDGWDRLTLSITPAGSPGPRLHLWLATGEDPRDLLDRGVDLLATRDAATIDYAATLPEFDSHPLPWDLTYTLLLRPAGPPPEGLDRRPESSTKALEDLLGDLAKDAVGGEARPAVQTPEQLYELPDLARCPSLGAPPSAPPQAPPSPILHYLEGDRVAGALGARLLALTRDPASPHYPRELFGLLRLDEGLRAAVGLSPAELEASLSRGSAAAYVLPFAHPLPSPCAWAEELLATIPWLPRPDGRTPSLLPLVQTRRRLLARRNLVRIWVDRDAVPRLHPRWRERALRR